MWTGRPTVNRLVLLGGLKKKKVMGRKNKIKAKPRQSEKPIPYTPTHLAIDEKGEVFRAEIISATEVRTASGLKDTGARTTSVTGALREPDNALAVRPRYDLIPPFERARIIHAGDLEKGLHELQDTLADILAGGTYGEGSLLDALAAFASTLVNLFPSSVVAWRRLAIHYARGAIKYADRNWEKGLETGRTIASLERHVGQAIDGDTDEDHLAAALWNTIALMYAIPRIVDGRYPMALDTYKLFAKMTEAGVEVVP